METSFELIFHCLRLNKDRIGAHLSVLTETKVNIYQDNERLRVSAVQDASEKRVELDIHG